MKYCADTYTEKQDGYLTLREETPLSQEQKDFSIREAFKGYIRGTKGGMEYAIGLNEFKEIKWRHGIPSLLIDVLYNLTR
jgi:hypothetical protein